MINEIIDSKFFEPDYKSQTLKFLYEDVSYDAAIKMELKKYYLLIYFYNNIEILL